MRGKKKIAVVVPAYNEGSLIGRVIQTMPAYVDRIYVIDDNSQDDTVAKVRNLIENGKRKGVALIHQQKNSGVGAAIVRGYWQATEDGMQVVAVMAGDAQMDPDDLASVLDPVISGEADYSKG